MSGPPGCETCEGDLADARYVHVDGGGVHVYCSGSCFEMAQAGRRLARQAVRRRELQAAAVVLALVIGCLTRHEGPLAVRRPLKASATPAASAPARPALPPGWYGPEWPPNDTSLLASLGRDAWIHPLSGPVRRMPLRESRVFGAPRPGDRAVECRNGHCGVDLGGEIWGEHIHAVHDGVVDFVQRGANPDRGGEFVRLSHRAGTVFSWYFHLAAIPAWVVHGVPVKSGDVIGLLGDTGVKESAPHLHFALTVKPGKGWPERYMDPEPLIALWPLHVPIDGGETGLVTTVAEVGLPLGSANLRAGRKRKASRSGGGEAASQGDHGHAAPAPDGDEQPAAGADDSGESSESSEASPED